MPSSTPSLSSLGVGSGLDVNSIISGLMGVEKVGLNRLQTAAASTQSELSAFGRVQSQLGTLADTMSRLSASTAWTSMQASSGDSSTVGVSADSTAIAGSHTVTVSRLAQPQLLASGTFTNSSAVVGTGKLSIEFGTTDASGFTAKSGSTPLSITIDSSNNTLAGVRDAINKANAGVTASIVTGAGGSRLVLRGGTGAANSMRITAADDDGDNGDAAGLSSLAWDPAATAGAGRNMTQTQAALNAQFNIDGVDLESGSNTVANALDGVSLTLSKVSSTPVSVDVSVPTSTLQKNVTDFVAAWNGMNTLMRSLTANDPTGNNDGPLQGDFTASQVLRGLRNQLLGSVAGVAGPSTLNAIGVTLQQDGSLKADTTKLSSVSPKQLSDLFTQVASADKPATAGIAVRFKTWTDSLTKTGGLLAGRQASLQSEIKDNQSRQDRENTRLSNVEAALRRQYSTLDTTMSNLNQQLAQMKSALGLNTTTK